MRTSRIVTAALSALLLAGCGSTVVSHVSHVTALAAWESGTGGHDLQRVVAGLDRIAAGNLDGARLSADAEVAENNPPPVGDTGKVQYILAMAAYDQAGKDIIAGNITHAATMVMEGDNELTLVVKAAGGSL